MRAWKAFVLVTAVAILGAAAWGAGSDRSSATDEGGQAARLSS